MAAIDEDDLADEAGSASLRACQPNANNAIPANNHHCTAYPPFCHESSWSIGTAENAGSAAGVCAVSST